MSMQTMSLDRYEGHRASASSSASLRDRNRSSRKTPTTRIVSHASGVAMREQTLETSLSVLVWSPTSAAANSPSALSKTPILRDVPQVKRKFGRKDRDSTGAPFFDNTSGVTGANSAMALSEPKSFANLKNAAPSWLREKPSKAKLTGSNSTQPKVGSWKRSTLTFRETGNLLIFGEDRTMLHSISASELSVCDVRLVDDSLFGRPYVLGIFARPSTLTAGVRSPLGQAKASTSTLSPASSSKGKEAPIYICFPTSRKLYSWRSLLRTFARPETFGPANPSKAVSATHRASRQIEMTIHEIRLLADRSSLTSERMRRTSGATSTGLLDADDMASGSRYSPSTVHADQQSINNQPANRRRSLEASARTLGSMMERITSRDTSNSHAFDVRSHNDDSLEDTKSNISADDLTSTNGPVTGAPPIRPTDSAAAHLTSGFSAVDMDRRGSDGSSNNTHIHTQPQNVSLSACFCQIWLNGDVVARTKVCSGTTSIAWFDKFLLQDLPLLGTLHIEVLQAWRPTKYVVLGHIDVPIETMRRGETVEGWYPIWALPRLEDAWSRRDERSASYTREMVGELKVALNVFDETILSSSSYVNVSALLNGEKSIDLMKRLCIELEEDRIMSLLVDVFTTGGTIVDRLSDLTKAESSSFSPEPALLFRGNTLLSRAIDKYQRKYCLDWLEACIGPTVRKVCAERIKIEPGEASPVMSPITLSGTHSSPYPTVSVSTSHEDSSIEVLRKLSEDLWTTIYANRHKCPPDLRRALAVIRRTVNQHYKSTHGPGVQGVGAFVFLRLICPAITSPNLYGLMGSAPDQNSSARTLMLLAKVFLALANKRQAFDKDKEPWLGKMNSFLQQQAEAYDDFITIVSSEPDETERIETLGDEKDLPFQRLVKQRLESLPSLHRESIPHAGLGLDHAQAISSLVSYVVRKASVDPYEDETDSSENDISTSHFSSYKENATGSGNGNGGCAELINDFVDMCIDIEDMVGYHLDRAGFQPEPIESGMNESIGGVFRTTSIFTASKGSPSIVQSGSGHLLTGRASPIRGLGMYRGSSNNAPTDQPNMAIQRTESLNSMRMRRATVSGQGRLESSDEYGNGSTTFRPKMSYIGEDSFLRARDPDNVQSKRPSGEEQHVGQQSEEKHFGMLSSDVSQTWDSTNGARTSLLPVSHDISAASSYDVVRRGASDDQKRRQSAHADSLYVRDFADAAGDFDSTRSLPGQGRSEADSARLASRTGKDRSDAWDEDDAVRSGIEDDRQYSPPFTPSSQRFRQSLMSDMEDPKKKRNWWRRNK